MGYLMMMMMTRMEPERRDWAIRTPPISRKLAEDSTPEASAPINSEFSNHTLSIHPTPSPSLVPEAPSFASMVLLRQRIPRGRESSLEGADVWLYTEVAISQCQPGHPAVPPVGNGSSTVILIKELMGKVCPSTGTFICFLKVKPITAGLRVY